MVSSPETARNAASSTDDITRPAIDLGMEQTISPEVQAEGYSGINPPVDQPIEPVNLNPVSQPEKSGLGKIALGVLIGATLGGITAALSNQNLVERINQTVRGAGNLVKKAANGVDETVRGVGDAVSSVASGIGDTAKDVGEAVRTAADGVSGTVQNTVGAVATTAADVNDTVGDAVNVVKDTAATMNQAVGETVGDAAKNVVETTIGTAGQAVGQTVGQTVGQAIGSSVEKLVSPGGNASSSSSPIPEHETLYRLIPVDPAASDR